MDLRSIKLEIITVEYILGHYITRKYNGIGLYYITVKKLLAMKQGEALTAAAPVGVTAIGG